MENTYRDVNIAIANEFSRLADRFGVDVWEAISLANKHPRVKILNPGPGVGGHCISVDPWFFVEAAPDLTPLIRTARIVNDGQPHFVLHMVQRALGDDLNGKQIAVLGSGLISRMWTTCARARQLKLSTCCGMPGLK